MEERATYLVVLGHRDAVPWVLKEQRMAFTANRKSLAMRVRPGDSFLLYTTRSIWGNPTRDRGRVMGQCEVLTRPVQAAIPASIGGREFPFECRMRVEGVAPFGDGVDLGQLVDRMDAFPRAHAWSAYLRQPLVLLPSNDTELLRRVLTPLLKDASDVIPAYEIAAAGVRGKRSGWSEPDWASGAKAVGGGEKEPS